VFLLGSKNGIIKSNCSHEGVKMDANKIKSIRECPVPKTLKKLEDSLD